MKRTKVLYFFGLLALFVASFSAFFWVYITGPLRKSYELMISDRDHDRLLWDALKKSINRFGWTHDDGLMVGLYGDEQFASFIITQIDDKTNTVNDYGHKLFALSEITNQVGIESGKEWLKWWQKNKDKNQEEWIKDGFEKVGIDLHERLLSADILELLIVIGDKERFQAPLRTNAFRWLRDSDFDVFSFKYSDFPTENSDKVLKGLLIYSSWNAVWPKNKSPLTLDLGRRPKSNVRGKMPNVCSLSVKIGVWLFIILNMIGSIIFLLKARKGTSKK